MIHKIITTERAMSRWCLKSFHEKPEETESDDEETIRKETNRWVEWRKHTARRSANISKQNKTKPWAIQAMQQLWKWAGHIARHNKQSGTRASTDPPAKRNTRGRPPATWDSIIRKFANASLGLEQDTWTNIAQNRQTWSSLEEVFTDYVKETFVQTRTRRTLEADET